MSEEMNAQNTVNESTTSQEPETSQEVDTGAEAVTTPEGSENTEETSASGSDDSVVATEEAEAAPFITVKFNHEEKGLTREEAITLAQKGLKYDGTHGILERVAALKGVSVDEFLNGLEAAEDEAYRKELIDRFGEDSDAVSSMMELREIKKQQTIDAARAKQAQASAEAEQNENSRLANEFLSMKEDFPELTDFASLPNAVKKAARDGMSLSHAYLLYLHKENKKIAAEKQNAESAAKRSTGSIADSEATDFVGDAFLRGLAGK